MATRKSTTKGAARAVARRNYPPAVPWHAPASAADRRAQLLGEFSDALDMVKTAFTALGADERNTFTLTVLQLAHEVLQKVYAEIDRERLSTSAVPATKPHIAEVLNGPPYLPARLNPVLDEIGNRDGARHRDFDHVIDDGPSRSDTKLKGGSGRKACRRRRVR